MKWIIVVSDPKTGKQQRGTVEASTRESAEEKVRRRGLLLSSIQAFGEAAESQTIVRRTEATIVEVPHARPINRNLVQCPACEQMISVAAANCPACGHPMREPTTAQTPQMPQIIMQAPAAAPTIIHNVVSSNSNSSATARASTRGGLGCLGSLFRTVGLVILAVIMVILAFAGYAIYLAN